MLFRVERRDGAPVGPTLAALGDVGLFHWCGPRRNADSRRRPRCWVSPPLQRYLMCATQPCIGPTSSICTSISVTGLRCVAALQWCSVSKTNGLRESRNSVSKRRSVNQRARKSQRCWPFPLDRRCQALSVPAWIAFGGGRGTGTVQGIRGR